MCELLRMFFKFPFFVLFFVSDSFILLDVVKFLLLFNCIIHLCRARLALCEMSRQNCCRSFVTPAWLFVNLNADAQQMFWLVIYACRVKCASDSGCSMLQGLCKPGTKFTDIVLRFILRYVINS